MQGILGEKINGAFPASVLQRAISAVQRRVLPKVSPQAIFGSRVGSLIAKPEKVFLLISHDDSCVEVRPTPPVEMARRIAHMAQYEQSKFMEHYLAFKLRFPQRRTSSCRNLLRINMNYFHAR